MAQRVATWWSLLPGAMVNISANIFTGARLSRSDYYDGGAGIHARFYARAARTRHPHPFSGPAASADRSHGGTGK